MSSTHVPAPRADSPGPVLVVDDDIDIRETIAECLEAEGIEVRAAEHGQRALEVLRAEPSIGLVLLDLSMPVLDGHGFLAARRADAALSRVPVVVVTAGPIDPPPVGAAAVLQKPITLRTLLGILAAHGYASRRSRES